MKPKNPNEPKVEIRKATTQDWQRVADTIKARKRQSKTGKR
jgi:hypothetical protein